MLRRWGWAELTFDLVFASDDHEGEFRIPNHNTLQSDSVYAARPHDFNLSSMVICACQQAAVDVCSDDVVLVAGCFQRQDFVHVADPHPVQTFVDGIFAFLLFELVNTEDSLLLGGERLGFLLAEEVCFLS